MPRYQVILEYDGSPFVGWQRQRNGLSVQEALERAVEAFSGERVVAVAAGRTDAGVHALAQSAHFDLRRPFPPERVAGALNAHLRPLPVAVLEARCVSPAFDARFSAVERAYVYRILNRRAPPALERNRVWHLVRRLDAERMHDAAQLLVGRHDFSSFRASECQARSAVKTLSGLYVLRRGEVVEIHAAARSFLHHQVRNMVGSLVLVGEGARPVSWLRDVLAARDRRAAGPTAPPHGLYFRLARYPPQALWGAGD